MALPERFDPAAPLNSCDATAVYLGLSRGLVYELARKGKLPSNRYGRRLAIVTAPLLATLGKDAENS